MKKLLTTVAALIVLTAMPAWAASSNGGTARTGAPGVGPNPGMRPGTSGTGVGVTAPNTGPERFQNNRTPYATTAPPVPGSAQDPYGNSASGSSSGTRGSGSSTEPSR